MTSLERRREKRYQRRKALRDAKKRRLYAENDRYENIISYRSLYNANRQSIKSVSWKASVQRYQMNLLRNIHDTHRDLANGKSITKGFVEFNAIERGKVRHIRSVHYSERVVQRSTSDNALVPLLSRGLIYDNGACIKGKGVDRSLDRLDVHLRRFYRTNQYSNDGYIVLFDFKGYFDSIRHDICLQAYDKAFTDERILELLKAFVYPFGFPFANGNWRKEKRPMNPEEYTGKSLGLGSQISQITAVSYPNALDHYIKQVLRVRFYGRYMDDGYMMFRKKEDAKAALAKVYEFCQKYGITINRKKTQIVKLSRCFIYLKVKHRLTETGKVIRGLSRTSITRQRRKLKKFHKMYLEGKLPLEDIRQAYGSWKGYALRSIARETVRNMNRLYFSLFHEQPPKCKLEH